jgi:hypothetical protein
VYRDSRPSVEARICGLETELDEAETESRRRDAAVASLLLQLFPLFEHYDDSTQVLSRRDVFSHAVVSTALAAMSVVALPLAILWRPLRRDRRAARRARQRVEQITAELGEARQTLRALEAPQSNPSSPPTNR